MIILTVNIMNVDSLNDSDRQFVYRALHLSVPSLPSKHDDLKVLLANFQEAGISLVLTLFFCVRHFIQKNNFK